MPLNAVVENKCCPTNKVRGKYLNFRKEIRIFLKRPGVETSFVKFPAVRRRFQISFTSQTRGNIRSFRLKGKLVLFRKSHKTDMARYLYL